MPTLLAIILVIVAVGATIGAAHRYRHRHRNPLFIHHSVGFVMVALAAIVSLLLFGPE